MVAALAGGPRDAGRGLLRRRRRQDAGDRDEHGAIAAISSPATSRRRGSTVPSGGCAGRGCTMSSGTCWRWVTSGPSGARRASTGCWWTRPAPAPAPGVAIRTPGCGCGRATWRSWSRSRPRSCGMRRRLLRPGRAAGLCDLLDAAAGERGAGGAASSPRTRRLPCRCRRWTGRDPVISLTPRLQRHRRVLRGGVHHRSRDKHTEVVMGQERSSSTAAIWVRLRAAMIVERPAARYDPCAAGCRNGRRLRC